MSRLTQCLVLLSLLIISITICSCKQDKQEAPNYLYTYISALLRDASEVNVAINYDYQLYPLHYYPDVNYTGHIASCSVGNTARLLISRYSYEELASLQNRDVAFAKELEAAVNKELRDKDTPLKITVLQTSITFSTPSKPLN